MMHVNPMYYLRHAWEATNSCWGKICIVMFYLFIWMNIVWALQILIVPTAGFECLWSNFHKNDFEATVALMKNMNIWTIGFMLYADRGGIKVWNVGMVCIFYVIQWFQLKGSWMEFAELSEGGEDCDDEVFAMQTTMTVTQIWIFVTLFCAWMESRAGNHVGTVEENQHLTGGGK